MALPANTVIVDDDSKPRQPAQAPPGTPQQQVVDNRPHHARAADDEPQVIRKEDDTITYSPDEPFTLMLRKPIMSSKGKGEKIKELVISPLTAEVYTQYGPYLVSKTEWTRDPRTGQETSTEIRTTDYRVMLKHLGAATGVPYLELERLSIPDMDRAGGVMHAQGRGLPFK